MVTLNIISESEANKWIAEMTRLNEDVKRLMDQISTTLKEVKDDADSTIVDEIYHYGSQMLKAAVKVFEGMNLVQSTVNTVLGKLRKMVDAAKGGVQSSIRKSGGFD